MKHKVVTASEAIALIRDGDTLVNTGFVGCGAPEDLLALSNNVISRAVHHMI